MLTIDINDTPLARPSIVAMQALCELASIGANLQGHHFEAGELRDEAARYREWMAKPEWRAHLSEPLFGELGGDDCRSLARLFEQASVGSAAQAAHLRAQVGE